MVQPTQPRELNREQVLELVAFESRLSGRQEAAWLLHYRDGWDEEQIAVHLGIGAGTVRTHLTRAKAKVKAAARQSRYRNDAAALWDAFRGGAPSAPNSEALPSAKVCGREDFEDVLAARRGDEVAHLPAPTSSARVKKAHQRAISDAKR